MTHQAREPDAIEVRGAREHNLDVPHLTIPKRALVVFTGPSGSGKSSLAFDTLYAEGQRRYLETLSAYARQFLGQLERPHVDRIRGLSPTIAIEQKSAASNPRSTVGTITEIQDYVRVLYARVGEQRCIACGKLVKARSAAEIAREIAEFPSGTRLRILARLVTHRKGEHRELFADLKQRGFLRVEVGGDQHSLDDPPTLAKHVKHTIDLVVDRIVLGSVAPARIAEAVESALNEGKGELVCAIDLGKAANGKSEERIPFSANRACCGRSYPELSPPSFSFNSPLGSCPECQGLGVRAEVDPGLVVADPDLSIKDGAILPWASAMSRGEGWIFRIAEAAARACKVSLSTPWKKIPKDKQKKLLHGIGDSKLKVSWGKEGSDSHGTFGVKFEGVIPNLERLYRETNSESMREHYKKFFRDRPCGACKGRRLRPESLAVYVGQKNIGELMGMTVEGAVNHVRGLTLRPAQKRIAEGALVEIESRLKFLLDVGLDYLTLDRPGPSLSGGEAQRIRLASQLGSELSGVMYVLDEPSIGLHPRDNARLVSTLRHLRDLGNTVLVVEHDEETIRAADHVVDFGPGAGHLGGKVIAEGSPSEIEKNLESITGAFLSGRKSIEVPAVRREPKAFIEVVGAREHNLKNVDVKIPLGVLCCVTGVSGAGKSSLVNGILLPALGAHLHDSAESIGEHKSIKGIDKLDKVIAIDQKPIGRTPRSNPGTYTKAFDLIREVFAQLPDARARGYDAGRFSFNVKGGRCEACGGDGEVKVEMHFLADVRVPCESCFGKRYDEATLEIRFKGKSIADILDTSVDECLELFSAFPALRRILETLVSVGLGYMKIGQSAPTLSGGEAQRVKLSRELGKVQTGRTLYVLDEPTTGLHFEDIRRLLSVLMRLVEAGNTVVVIEHNLDVVKCADWVVDLGPEGGAKGGEIVCTGTPEEVARHATSYTGKFLRDLLAPKVQPKKNGTPKRLAESPRA
ncbi:Excinuclease ABC subunit A [Labilithrix luteola]|uniref:UvrABC system protein A n=1 Tax=Labilithrix luteola TaxID=1391654 RepID=A0A0K1PUX9_9BACT|nr:excinuclease ABC subunit UvrA [Labilithrix luteola]AKU97327.1 Excinuclease ABC subunit A [Labilithrix luteola]